MGKRIYIFGAHSRAQTLGVYLRYLYPDIEIAAYLYDNEESNPEAVEGIPVIFIGNGTRLNLDYPVYLGTRGVYHPDLTKKLRRLGIKIIIPVTPELDRELRNRYLTGYFSETGREFRKLERLAPSVRIYEVKSVFWECGTGLQLL